MEREKIKEYLDVLACPECKGDLEYREKEGELPEGFYCPKCKLLYPIIEDIPIMLPEEAISIREK